jgi:predicted DNA-binding transcriptional regulator AlpA
MRSHRRRKSKSVRIKRKICRDPRSRTIDQFCRLHGFARSTYYLLKAQGLGPREMRIGRIVRISARANTDWSG